MNKKKAMMMSVGLALATAIVMTRIFSAFVGVETELMDNFQLGQNQVFFIEAMQENQKALLFEDQYWSFAAGEMILELFEQGGYYETNDCGTYQGYYVWKSNDTTCYPTLSIINEEAEKSLKRYTGIRKTLKNDPKADYDFYVGSRDGKTVVEGSTMSQIATDIRCTGGTRAPMLTLYPDFFNDNAYVANGIPDSCGRIYDRPSFSHKIDADIGIFNNIVNQVPGIITGISKCEQQGKSISACKEETLSKLNLPGMARWMDECDAGLEGVYETVIKQYIDCLEANSTECICKLDPPYEANVPDAYYSIKFSREGAQTTAGMGMTAELDGYPAMPKKRFTTIGPSIIENPDQPNIYQNEVIYKIEYVDGKLDDVFMNVGLIDWRPGGDGKQWLYKPSKLLASFVDTNNYASFAAKPSCELPAQGRQVKLCVDTGRFVFAYDKKSENLGVQRAVIKFAVYIPKI